MTSTADVPRKTTVSRIRLTALAAALAALGVAAPASATEVKLENYSNGTIYVAVAYRHYKGNTIAEGWFAIPSNGTKTIQADDKSDMHLRIQTAKGTEVTFPKHKTFHNWPVEPERFLLNREPDDDNVRVYKWGKTLQHTHNSQKAKAPPTGWASKRFFEVGNGKHTLKIEPNN